ncbi:MAG: hypothetical protein GEEBNDBF_01252 [bacterium]|nr:hypothetical protein [bacterium]
MHPHDPGSPVTVTGLDPSHAQVLCEAIAWQSTAHQFDRRSGTTADDLAEITLHELIHDVLPSAVNDDPSQLEFPLRLASFLRQYAGDGYAARTLLRCIALSPSYTTLLRRWVPSILPHPADLVAFLQEWESAEGGWTCTALAPLGPQPVPSTLRQGIRDAWQTYRPGDITALSRRQRDLLRHAHRALRLTDSRNAGLVSVPAGGINAFLDDAPDADHSPVRMLSALATALKSGAPPEPLLRRLGDPATWGPEVWPVHLFAAWLQVADLLSPRHPWSIRTTNSLTPSCPDKVAEAACRWLDQSFRQMAHRLSLPPCQGFVIVDNLPNWRRQHIPATPWSYPVAAFSQAATLLASGHAQSCWLLAPTWHEVAASPPEEPLPLVARLLSRGQQWRGWNKQAPLDVPQVEGEFCCWISPAPTLPMPLWRRIPDRYPVCWLAPGLALGEPPLTRSRSRVGLSGAMLESLLAAVVEGSDLTDFVLARPLWTGQRPTLVPSPAA